MGLQQLSVRVLSDTGEGMEAHLVSVSASTSQKSDGSASSRLRMGWFWVLDRFHYQHTRRQRLVLHSTLPHPAASFAKEGSYDILGALRAQGVFEKDYSGSSELADVTLTTRGTDDETSMPMKDPFASKDPFVERADIDKFLNAQFSSFYFHWNPQAVEAMIQAFGQTVASLQDVYKSKIAAIQSRPQSAISECPVTSASWMLDKASDEKVAGMTMAQTTVTLVKAELKSFEITLDSSNDDEALFVLTMSDTKVQMLSSQLGGDSNTMVSMGLGDLRIGIPETNGKSCIYRTMLGLASDQSTSLLSVNFSMGAEAVQALGLEGVDSSKCDMCAEVTLSPMQFVYIQAQVMMLVAYITDGILGALTAQAASSAADAAVVVSQSAREEQYFVVKAIGIDVIIPKSADSKHHVGLRAGNMSVKYRGFSGSGGGEAHVSLSELSMEDGDDQKMLNTPIRVVVDVTLPPGDVGSMDDRAMQINFSVSQAAFLLTHGQYQLLMRILKENIGEADPCLQGSTDELDSCNAASPATQGALPPDVQADTDAREKGSSETSSAAIDSPSDEAAGAQNVQNRMYLGLSLDGMSLELCGTDNSDAIVNIAAVKGSITMKLLPDEDAVSIEAALHNLTCDDRRLKAMHRPFRSLIAQSEDDEPGYSNDDVFHASFKKIGDTSSEVDLKLGSPRLVFIPDVIADVLQFLKTDQEPDNRSLEPTETNVEQPDEHQGVESQDGATEESVEVAIVSSVQGSDSQDATTMSLTIQPAKLSIVLIDMGSFTDSTDSPTGSASISLTALRTPVTESIVFQGQFGAQMSVSSDLKSGRVLSANAEIHGECMEVYTAFGSKFTSPIQIVEPASVSTFFTLMTPGGSEDSKELDITVVTLSPVDITFSMQNAALLNAIFCSCTDCFNTGDIETVHVTPAPLSAAEASRIEALASALESPNALERRLKPDNSSAPPDLDNSSVSIKSEAVDSTSIITRVQVTMTETKVTLINDLQGLDEGLFRLNANNFIARGHVHQGVAASTGLPCQTTFDFQVDTSLLADYFDSSVQLWEVLLKKPWEITAKCSRDPGAPSMPDRMSTVLDIEAYPCFVSFSEQFLASIAAASKMWSIYSMATTKAAEGDKVVGLNDHTGGRSGVSKKAQAASAARQLITCMPYAVENHSGLNIAFVLTISGERRSCPSGTIQYFRFRPPQGVGSGGYRRYGQDATRQKSMTLFVCGDTIDVENIETGVGQPHHAYDLGGGRCLLAFTAKEGKTTVSVCIATREIATRTRLESNECIGTNRSCT